MASVLLYPPTASGQPLRPSHTSSVSLCSSSCCRATALGSGQPGRCPWSLWNRRGLDQQLLIQAGQPQQGAGHWGRNRDQPQPHTRASHSPTQALVSVMMGSNMGSLGRMQIFRRATGQMGFCALGLSEHVETCNSTSRRSWLQATSSSPT